MTIEEFIKAVKELALKMPESVDRIGVDFAREDGKTKVEIDFCEEIN
jgi:hypothetical protein